MSQVTLDLAGRRIVEAADSDEEEPQMGAAAEDEKAPVYAGILNPSLRGPPPVFTKGKKAAKKVKPGDENPAMDGRRSRVQQDDVWADMDVTISTFQRSALSCAAADEPRDGYLGNGRR